MSGFDADEVRDQLQANAPTDGGTGWIAVVLDLGPRGDRRRKPLQVFNSKSEFRDAGVFAEHQEAITLARRWADGTVARRGREHDLRLSRGIALAGKLQGIAIEQADLELQKKVVGNRIKTLDDNRRALVREANDPEVELDIGPSSDRWRLYDAPSESEGTAASNNRQLALEGTGVEGAKAVEEGATTRPAEGNPTKTKRKRRAPPKPTKGAEPVEKSESEADRKLPGKVRGSDKKLIKPGDRVKTGSGDEAWLVSIDGFLKGGSHRVTIVFDDASAPSVLGAHQLHKVPRARGSKAPQWPPSESSKIEGALTEALGGPELVQLNPKPKPPGLDPKGVRWPEDEPDGAA